MIQFTEVAGKWISIAHISLIDPGGSVDEVIWAKEYGGGGGFLSPDMVARRLEALQRSRLCPFLGNRPGIGDAGRLSGRPVRRAVVARLFGGEGDFGLFNFAFLAMDVMATFTQMIALGMFESYPRLKYTVLECGANWISAWLDHE